MQTQRRFPAAYVPTRSTMRCFSASTSFIQAQSYDSKLYLAQERPMAGSAEVPFTLPEESSPTPGSGDVELPSSSSYNYSQGGRLPYSTTLLSKNISQARARKAPAHLKIPNIAGTVLSGSTASTTLSRSRVPTAS